MIRFHPVCKHTAGGVVPVQTSDLRGGGGARTAACGRRRRGSGLASGADGADGTAARVHEGGGHGRAGAAPSRGESGEGGGRGASGGDEVAWAVRHGDAETARRKAGAAGGVVGRGAATACAEGEDGETAEGRINGAASRTQAEARNDSGATLLRAHRWPQSRESDARGYDAATRWRTRASMGSTG